MSKSNHEYVRAVRIYPTEVNSSKFTWSVDLAIPYKTSEGITSYVRSTKTETAGSFSLALENLNEFINFG
jgi:hypothetical protein